MSKIIKSGGLLGNAIGKLGRKALMKFVNLLDKDILPLLTTRATMSVIDNFEKNWKWSSSRSHKNRKRNRFDGFRQIKR